jgi:hypothetical protein
LSLGREYGVDPFIFALIYVGSSPLMWLSIGWLMRNVRNGRPILVPALSALFWFVSIYIYLLAVGRSVPGWVWVALVGMGAGGAWSTLRSIRRRFILVQ